MSENGDEFDPYEVAAQAEINLAALAWVELVRAARSGEMWANLDPDFRLAYAQLWIVDNPDVMVDPSVTTDRDAFAAELAASAPTHPLWPHLLRVATRNIREASLTGIGNRELGGGSRARLVGPDLELVRLIPVDQLQRDTSGHYTSAPDQQVWALSLIMRHRPSGWHVAGIGHVLMQPGWPPVQLVVASPSD